jgi:anti-sigma B factor antagonist
LSKPCKEPKNWRTLSSDDVASRGDKTIFVQEAAVDLKIHTREVENVTIVDISGRIILGDETSRLRQTVRDLISKDKKKIVLNLADVSYIDSSGVGELVASYTAVRNAGGELKLLNLTKKVHDLLQVTKLYTIFDIKDDEFMAIKSFDWFFAK